MTSNFNPVANQFKVFDVVESFNTLSLNQGMKVLLCSIKTHFSWIIYLHNCFMSIYVVEPNGVQDLKNPNPLKDVEAFAMLDVVVLV